MFCRVESTGLASRSVDGDLLTSTHEDQTLLIRRNTLCPGSWLGVDSVVGLGLRGNVLASHHVDMEHPRRRGWCNNKHGDLRHRHEHSHRYEDH